MNPRFPDAPPQIRALPLDPRGYPIPWFVGVNPKTGERDFRFAHASQVDIAVKSRRCWICGRAMGIYATFVIGPMCAVNRISSEPPSHLDCARFAARACPFLTTPKARRDPRGIDIEAARETVPGIMIERNPGVVLLWKCRSWKQDRHKLFRLGRPMALEWFAEGREATRAEVLASIESGLPALVAACDLDDNPVASRRELDRDLAAALELVPPT
jgi:hypothetical protein